MRPRGRRPVALVGLLGTIAAMLCVSAAGLADTPKTDAELTTKEIGSKETLLGDVVADAIRTAAKSDVAIIAASYFTKDFKLPKGDVKTEELLKSLEYKGDSIVIVTLTGKQVTRAMEHALYLHPKSNSGFLQFSGMTVTINPEAEKEKRVVSIKVDGDSLDAGKKYKVAMPTPLANGALAYFKIWDKDAIDKESEKKLEKVTLEVAITDYLKEHKTLTKGDDRLATK